MFEDFHSESLALFTKAQLCTVHGSQCKSTLERVAHHEPPKAQGGCGIDFLSLCEEAHIDRHSTSPEEFYSRHNVDPIAAKRANLIAWLSTEKEPQKTVKARSKKKNRVPFSKRFVPIAEREELLTQSEGDFLSEQFKNQMEEQGKA